MDSVFNIVGITVLSYPTGNYAISDLFKLAKIKGEAADTIVCQLLLLLRLKRLFKESW